eukprot:COSAG05_NODE_612_length_8357_cov_40.832647_5_plen_115_part_00
MTRIPWLRNFEMTGVYRTTERSPLNTKHVPNMCASHRRYRYLSKGLEALGFDIGQSETPIIPVMLGDEDHAREFSAKLFDEVSPPPPTHTHRILSICPRCPQQICGATTWICIH